MEEKGLQGSIRRPIKIPGRRTVITKNMILEAQKHTKSNAEAARSGLFERHINERMELVKTQNEKLFGNNLVSALDNAIEDDGEVDLVSLADDFTLVSKEIVDSGMNGTRANEILIDNYDNKIRNMFDGNKKGIPILSVLGVLNDGFKGGELTVFFQKT